MQVTKASQALKKELILSWHLIIVQRNLCCKAPFWQNESALIHLMLKVVESAGR